MDHEPDESGSGCELLILNMDFEIQSSWFLNNGSISSIIPFSEKHLLVGVGSKLYMLMYNAGEIIQLSCFLCRWPITCLDSDRDKILVGSQREGLSTFIYDTIKNEFQFSRRFSFILE